MNNKKGLKKLAGILSASLMLSGIFGVASTISGDTNTAVVAEAATKKSEAQLRQIVLGKFPGTVQRVKQDWDDGIKEYEYTIKKSDGVVVKVEITEYGYITDVDYEGQWKNGRYYDWD